MGELQASPGRPRGRRDRVRAPAGARPTTELRQLQYAADDAAGVGKRSRERLAPEYVERYTREILDAVDLEALAADLPSSGTTALLCVERDPEACHRSLITERLERLTGVPVAHLRPGAA